MLFRVRDRDMLVIFSLPLRRKTLAGGPSSQQGGRRESLSVNVLKLRPCSPLVGQMTQMSYEEELEKQAQASRHRVYPTGIDRAGVNTLQAVYAPSFPVRWDFSACVSQKQAWALAGVPERWWPSDQALGQSNCHKLVCSIRKSDTRAIVSYRGSRTCIQRPCQ